MPYIKAIDRPDIDASLEPLMKRIDEGVGPGDLNYVITRIVFRFWSHFENYAAIASITGVLENVKQEFYRRVAAPYEDGKIAENGDVY